MRIATKLGLAEWFEKQAADEERRLAQGHPYADLYRDRVEQYVHNCRTAAYAIRKLTTEQEIDMLEWQAGGPDGSGIESYDNPIKIVRPVAEIEPPTKRSWIDNFRDPLWDYG